MTRPKLPEKPPFCAGPFEVCKITGHIYGVSAFGGQAKVADMRGWGYLTGQGQALALSYDEAYAAQIATAEWIVDAMNEKLARTHKDLQTQELIHAVGKMLKEGGESFRLGLGAEVLNAYQAVTEKEA